MKKTQKKMIRQMSKVITNDLIKMIESLEKIQEKAEKKDRKKSKAKARFDKFAKAVKDATPIVLIDDEDDDVIDMPFTYRYMCNEHIVDDEYCTLPLHHEGHHVDEDEEAFRAHRAGVGDYQESPHDRVAVELAVSKIFADRWGGQIWDTTMPLPKLADVLTDEDISYLEKSYPQFDVAKVIEDMDEADV